MANTDIHTLLGKRILLLDGGMGTMIQRARPTESDFRGERYADHPVELKGCNDVLALTSPDIIRNIHRAYLEAGADIISTDSFNANAVSLADYALADDAFLIAKAAAETARSVADEFTAHNPHKPRFVAGSVGPTNRTSSIASDVEHPERREISFERLLTAYTIQVEALVAGGADLILIETVFDTLNAKAAIMAIKNSEEKLGCKIPVMLSGTPADSGGRMLCGQTIEAFYTSVVHAEPLSVGLNCAFGAHQMLPFLERLTAISEFYVSAHPNAGLPNIDGGYDQTPQMFADDVEEYMRRGLVNIVGGCCGTTPEHIFLLSQVAGKYAPRPLPERRHMTRLCGYEELQITPNRNFVNIGERANVAGSARFARLIRERNYEEAVAVARAQVDAGAQIIDICMDDGLIDGAEAMREFVNLACADPDIARVPLMIDSSSWEVLETGMRLTQGKSIVNSISLKEGEAVFLQRAHTIRRYGAAAVVMLFDERGQADTYERKIEVAERAYRLLTADGFPGEDIIFDPNVLAVATGIEEHDTYAKAFIDAVAWIKKNLPDAKVSGGISNLSFAFRGNNRVREAMHSVFLYHAIRAGLDMAIVNAQMLQLYEDIGPTLLERVEDVILCRRADASERLTDMAQQLQSVVAERSGTVEDWRGGTLAERVDYAMRRGVADHIESDALEAMRELGSPIQVIDLLLMPAMEHVGRLFGEGKMFLPQVVRSARVMKRAVAALTPYIDEAGDGSKKGCVVVATVKGDVHDIGKNIVGVVLSCNGWKVEDLGVMVEAETIIEKAMECDARAICLSGLITPSLEQMRRVCVLAEERGLKIPIIVGGATTSDMHTAVKMAPAYSGTVINARNASHNAQLVAQLTGGEADEIADGIRSMQEAMRDEFYSSSDTNTLLALASARENAGKRPTKSVVVPKHTGIFHFDNFGIAEVEPLIDWNFFFPAWEIKGRIPEIFDSPRYGEQARKLYADAQAMLSKIKCEKLLRLQGVVGIFPAESFGDDIILTDGDGAKHTLPMLRNQSVGDKNLSLADFVAESGDYVGCFALTAGAGLRELVAKYRAEGDDYSAIMAKLVADRLTEAFAEALHAKVRRELWGYENVTELTPKEIIAEKYRGRRMAFGYPASPDHSLKREVFDLLGVEEHTAMRLNENWMITPEEALCGLLFADAEYFSVGRIDSEQLADYALRRGLTVEEIARIIPNNITK